MKHINNYVKLIVIVLVVVAMPVIAFAAESVIDTEIFGENVEKVIEILNLVVALFAGVMAVKLAALSQGGSMEKTWNALAFSAIFFVLLEIVGSLNGFNLIHIGGLAEIFEFLFVAVFAYCLYFTKKDLLKKALS
jgi:hypothetical protein